MQYDNYWKFKMLIIYSYRLNHVGNKEYALYVTKLIYLNKTIYLYACIWVDNGEDNCT